MKSSINIGRHDYKAQAKPCKKTHIMTRLFERAAAMTHEVWDLLHNAVIGYSAAGVWVWLYKFFNFDYDFLFWCGFFLGIDTFTGLYKHFRFKTATVDGFSRFFDKLVIVIGTYLLLHGLQNAKPGQAPGELWFISGAHFTIYSWLAWSIVKNIRDISRGQFPPKAWVDALSKIFYRSEKKPPVNDQ